MLVTEDQIETKLIPRLLYYMDKKMLMDDSEITDEEISEILNGAEITDTDILQVLNEEYVPPSDADIFADNDFIFGD